LAVELARVGIRFWGTEKKTILLGYLGRGGAWQFAASTRKLRFAENRGTKRGILAWRKMKMGLNLWTERPESDRPEKNE